MKIMLEYYYSITSLRMIKCSETIYLFQEDWRTTAVQGPPDHDSNAVTQDVSFIHVVSG